MLLATTGPGLLSVASVTSLICSVAITCAYVLATPAATNPPLHVTSLSEDFQVKTNEGLFSLKVGAWASRTPLCV